ncbi:SEC10/PgrA surface exclusion domain-containing protein, partial [Lactobacillus salivarius]|nr:SEC10/PgrA surface exclusion domain-containing protein [Ligilactobacillus salivarius]
QAQKILDGTNAQEVKDNVTKTENQVKQDQTDLANKQNTVKDTQTSLDNAKDQVSKDTQAVNQANQDVTAKQNTADKTQQAQDKAQSDVNAAQNVVNNAQGKADDAKKVLDGTNAQEIKDQAAATKAQVAVDEIDVQSKQNSVNNAQTAVNKAQSDVNNAKAENDKAQQALVDAQDKANKTQQALNDAKTQRDNASQKVNSITDQLNSINTIVLPDGYAKVKNWSELQQFSEDGYKLNNFKHSEKDKEITLNPTKLTAEQQRDLTLWIAQVLNTARESAGVNNRNVVTDDSLKYAKVIADNYWDKFDHDTSALEKRENAIGGVSFSQESISLGYVSDETITLDELKEAIYSSILDMIFDDGDSNWGHAAQLTGMGLLSFGDPDEIYFGFSIDRNGVLHYENYEPSKIDSSIVYTIPDNISMLQAQLANAQSDLQTKQAAFETATSNNANAQNTLASAKTNTQNASQDLATKQATLDKANTNLNNAQQALKAAQTKLANDQELAKNAQEALDNLSADLKTKQANYDNAVKALNDAKADLQAKQTVLANAKAENDKAQQA